MRRKRLIWICSTLIAATIICSLLWPRARLTLENLARVQIGMSLSQVKELLGQPINNADYFSEVQVHLDRPFLRSHLYVPKSEYLPLIDITNAAILDIDDDRKFLWFAKDRGFCVLTDDKGMITKMQSFPV